MMKFRIPGPAWDNKNATKAVKAVNKMTDEAILIQVAQHARRWEAREAAVRNIYLKDQCMLLEFAKTDKNCNVRMAAIEKVSNPETKEMLYKNLIIELKYFVENSAEDQEARMDAARMLTVFYRRYGRADYYPREGIYIGGYTDNGETTHTDYDDCSIACTHNDYNTFTRMPSYTSYSFEFNYHTAEE